MKTNYNQPDVGRSAAWQHPLFKPLLTMLLVLTIGMSVIAQHSMLGGSFCYNGTNKTTLGLSGGTPGMYHVLLHFKPDGTIAELTLVLPSTYDPFNFVVDYGTLNGSQGLYVTYVYTLSQYAELVTSGYALNKVITGIRQGGQVWIYSSPGTQTLGFKGAAGSDYTLSGSTAVYCSGSAGVSLASSELSAYNILTSTGIPAIIPADEWVVNYQLYDGITPIGSAKPGTGSVLTWDGLTALPTTYTAKATRGSCAEVNMTGSPEISDQSFVKNTTTNLCYLTIQAAHDDALTLTGHTLYCLVEKTYTENLVLTKGITLMPAVGLPDLLPISIAGTIDINGDGVTIRDFDALTSTGTYAVKIFAGSDNYSIGNNHMITSTLNGILVEMGAGAGNISDNTFIDNSTGINVPGVLTGVLTMNNNTIDGTGSVHETGISNYAHSSIISGNIFTAVQTGIYNTGNNTTIHHCHFAGLNVSGTGVFNTGTGVTVHHNDFSYSVPMTLLTAINSSVAMNAVSNWYGTPYGPTADGNLACGTGSVIVGPLVSYDPWYFDASMTTVNGLPAISLSSIPDMSTITKTPLIISVTAGYPSTLSNYDGAVLTDALIQSSTPFPATAKVTSIKYNGLEVLPAEYTLTGGMVYLSDILGGATPLAGHNGLTNVWDITIGGFDTPWASNMTLNAVSYVNSKANCNNILGTEAFSVQFADASMTLTQTDVEVCTTVDPLKFNVSITYPVISNVNSNIRADARITSTQLIPAGTEITWGYNAAPSATYLVGADTYTLLLSEITGLGNFPLQGNTGTDTWYFEIEAPVGTYPLSVEAIAVLGTSSSVYEQENVTLIVHPLPTATLSSIGATHICTGATAHFSVALTGTAPWEITYNDGGAPVTVSNILTSPYLFDAVHTSNKTWTVTHVSDVYGCENSTPSSVKIYIGIVTTVGTPLSGPVCAGADVVIPIVVTNFDDVGALSLTLGFDPAVLTYKSYTSAFPTAFIAQYNPVFPGVLKFGGFDSQGDYLPNGATLFELTFTYNGGTTNLTWDKTNPDACQYFSFAEQEPFCDNPKSTYYIDALGFTGNARPTAVLSGTTTICDKHSTNLTINFTGTAPWVYSINGGTPVSTSSNPETISVTVNGTTVYSITSLSDGLCTAIPSDYAGSVTVTANPLPDAPVAGSVQVTYDRTEHVGNATAPLGSSVVWYADATGPVLASAPARTVVGTTSAWAESVNDITGCASEVRTLVTVTIDPKPITGNFTVDATKIYDGNTLANVLTRTLNDVIVPDDVSLSGGVANYDNKNIGTGKTVTLTGMTLAGVDAFNYTLTSVATTTADITIKEITGTFTVPASKVYDGGTVATVLTRDLVGAIGGDDVTLTGGDANYDTKDVGIGKVVTLTGMVLSGVDAGNYSLLSVATTTADITPLGLTGYFTVDPSKVYDGGTLANVLTRTLVGVIAPDDVVLTGGIANYDDKNVGTGKTVTLTGMTLSGLDIGNYTLSTMTTTTADITKLEITGNFTVPASKVYDGNTLATVLTRTLTGTIGGDVISLIGGTANYDNKNIGIGKTVTLTGAVLDGADAGNYLLTSVGTTTADITAFGITGLFTVIPSKVYDGNTLANVLTRTLVGVILPDDVTMTGGVADYDNKNIGVGKTVTLTGMTLSGVDAGNYTLTSVATTTADITVLGITGSFTVPATRVYDGTTVANILTAPLVGVVPGDVVTLTGDANYDTKHVGTGKTVTFSGWALSGIDAGNYTVTVPVTTTTANITKKAVTVYAVTDSRVYNNTTSSVGVPIVGTLFPGDYTVTFPTQVFSSKFVGTGKTLKASGWVVFDGNSGNNYSITYTNNLTGVITPLGITGSFTVEPTKVYDGNTSAIVLTRSLTGVLGTNVVNMVGGTANYVNKNVGVGKTVNLTGATLTGLDAGNYTLTSVTPTTADITVKSAGAAVVANDKCYDGNTTATLSSQTVTGVIAPDVVNLVVGAANFDNMNPGTGKTVTASVLSLSGADAPNYLLSVATATSTATIYDVPTASAVVTTAITCHGGTGTVTITASAVYGSPVFSYTFAGVTNSTGIFDNVIAGANIPWSVSSTTCPPVNGTLTVTEPAAIPITGTVTYYNTPNTPLANVTVELKQGGVTVQTMVTDINGAYTFATVCPGTYDIVCSRTGLSGYDPVNVTDAALVAIYSSPLGFVPIEKVKLGAGDGVMNNRLQPNDATRIQEYFMSGGTSGWLNRPAWTFFTDEIVPVNPAPNTNYEYPSVVVPVGSAPIVKHIYGMFTGDFNGSWLPGSKNASNNLRLDPAKTLMVEPGVEFELPVTVGSSMEVGAISMIVDLPADKLEVLGGYLSDNSSVPVLVNVIGNELRIGWNSSTPINLQAGDRLVTLKLRLIGSLAKDERIQLNLNGNPLNELADGSIAVIPNAVLFADVIGSTTNGIGVKTESSISLANYPNPFSETTTFVFTLPYSGDVTLELFDMLGKRVNVCMNETLLAGEHKLIFDASNLRAGVYTATLSLNADGQQLKRMIKIIRNY